MSGNADHSSSAGLRSQPGQENGVAAPPGVTLRAQGNVAISNSDIAGRDVNKNTTIDNRRRNVRIGLGLGGLALLAVVGFGIHAAASSAGSVVYEAGAQGAAGTLHQLQQAEVNGDASSWCFLASSNNSSTCQMLLSNGYSTPQSAGIRSKVVQIAVSQPSGGGDSYAFSLTYRGHTYPGLSMIWTGQRWELSPAIYLVALNDGGIFCAVIETAQGGGAILGVPVR